MQRLLILLNAIVLNVMVFIFPIGTSAAVLMDEVVSSDTVKSTQSPQNGFVNALETRSNQPNINTTLITPFKLNAKPDNNAIDPEGIINEKVTANSSRKNQTFLMLIAIVGLILFIVRRRSGD